MTDTYEAWPRFTRKETFDIVRAHLLKQEEKAEEEDTCRYRTDKGLSCAAGCLIPDSEYTVQIEYNRLEFIEKKYGMTSWYGHDLGLVKELQRIHDTCDAGDWKWHLDELSIRIE